MIVSHESSQATGVVFFLADKVATVGAPDKGCVHLEPLPHSKATRSTPGPTHLGTIPCGDPPAARPVLP